MNAYVEIEDEEIVSPLPPPRREPSYWERDAQSATRYPPTPERQSTLPSFDQILAVLGAIAMVIGYRLALILALIATAVLAWRAIDTDSIRAIGVLGVFALFVFCPIVWVSQQKVT